MAKHSRQANDENLPSEAEIVEFIDSSPAPVGKREIARAFNIRGPQRVALKQLLRRMSDNGLIEKKGRRLQPPDSLAPVTVLHVTGLDEDGELTGEPANWEGDTETAPTVLIHSRPPRRGARDRGTPRQGDRVLARIKRTPASHYPYEASIIRRLPAAVDRVLGIYRKVPGQDGRVTPIDKKSRKEFDVLQGHDAGARSGELVAVATIHDHRHHHATVKVIERFGDVSGQANISLIAVHQYGIPVEFPEPIVAEVDRLKPFGSDKRTDLRQLPLITIDPEDARDHDDAVWAEPDGDPANQGGHRVIVAIADVACYVRPGTELDREARKRGNSVYLPDRVVPMLPERLSTDLCSLKQGKDRPVIACTMTFDAKGNRRSHRFERAVMRSAASLSYGQAQAAIDGRSDDAASPLLDSVLRPLWAAHTAVTKARRRRSPLELELPERKIVLDDDGNIADVVIPPRYDAHKLIEELMIQANVAAAETLQRQGSPLIYRVHDAPSPEKIAALGEFLRSIGLPSPAGQTMKPRQFNQLLEKCRGRDDEHVVNEIVLRTQAQAIYSAEHAGHFGLNLTHYAHFTSPIRRYADLIVHRALIAALKLGPGGLVSDDVARIQETAELISATERRAMAAERDTIDRLVAAFLSTRVRARFDGRIAGVAKAGLFIRLDDTGADGFVPASTIGNEYYAHDETRHALIGTETGETYQLGDSVEVRLLEVTPLSGGLRFEILTGGKAGKPPPRRHPRRYQHHRRGR